MGKKVSVRDVAAAAGSSIASVSRALNNTGYVSADLRRRVEHAVQATGYAPSFAARHRRTGRSRAVGFMVSSIANPFLASLFAEVERRMQFAGYALLVASSYDQPAREQELVALFESRQLEGIIASPGVETLPRASNPFAQTALPLVIIDREIECDGDVVYIDHRTGVRQAVEYLVSLGHTRIALFGPSTALPVAWQPRQYFSNTGRTSLSKSVAPNVSASNSGNILLWMISDTASSPFNATSIRTRKRCSAASP